MNRRVVNKHLQGKVRAETGWQGRPRPTFQALGWSPSQRPQEMGREAPSYPHRSCSCVVPRAPPSGWRARQMHGFGLQVGASEGKYRATRVCVASVRLCNKAPRYTHSVGVNRIPLVWASTPGLQCWTSEPWLPGGPAPSSGCGALGAPEPLDGGRLGRLWDAA